MSAVTETQNTSYISNIVVESVILSPLVTNAITLTSDSSVLVEVPTSSVLITGLVGPKGDSSEDLNMYAKRIDFISDTDMYIGEAVVGALESAPLWRIHRVQEISSDISETWAGGNSLFNKIWSDRLNYTYT